FKRSVRTFRNRTSRIPTLELLEPRITPATYNWNNLSGGDWNTVGNWTVNSAVANQLPGAADDVIIPSLSNGASVTHSQSVSDTVNSITASAPITLAGGTLSVTGNFSDSSAVTLGGGTLANATIAAGTSLLASYATSTLDHVTLAGLLHVQSSAFGAGTI